MIPAFYRSSYGKEVEAVQVTEENIEHVAAWCDGEVVRFKKQLISGEIEYHGIKFKSVTGPLHVRVGEYLVRHAAVRDVYRFYPYAAVAFHATYDPM